MDDVRQHEREANHLPEIAPGSLQTLQLDAGTRYHLHPIRDGSGEDAADDHRLQEAWGNPDCGQRLLW
jgi:hypothetical protein